MLYRSGKGENKMRNRFVTSPFLAMMVFSLIIASMMASLIFTHPSHGREKVVGMSTVRVPSGGPTPHSASLSWTAVTTCTDGTSCTVVGYNVYKASAACPASGLPTGAVKIASAITATTFVDTPLVPGTYCYYVTAIGGTGSNGAESAASNTSSGILAAPAIAAPTGFGVTVQ
jgi:hypothetical protein